MTVLPTLDAAEVLHLLVGWLGPFLEASVLPVSDLAALAAFYDVFLGAIPGFVADFVTFKTHFFSTLENVVSILAAENTRRFFRLVRAVLRNMAELLAIVAL